MSTYLRIQSTYKCKHVQHTLYIANGAQASTHKYTHIHIENRKRVPAFASWLLDTQEANKGQLSLHWWLLRAKLCWSSSWQARELWKEACLLWIKQRERIERFVFIFCLFLFPRFPHSFTPTLFTPPSISFIYSFSPSQALVRDLFLFQSYCTHSFRWYNTV